MRRRLSCPQRAFRFLDELLGGIQQIVILVVDHRSKILRQRRRHDQNAGTLCHVATPPEAYRAISAFHFFFQMREALKRFVRRFEVYLKTGLLAFQDAG